MRQGGLVGNLPEIARYIAHSILGHPVTDIVKDPFSFYSARYYCTACGASDLDEPDTVSRETKEE